jgi:hypothetical protein
MYVLELQPRDAELTMFMVVQMASIREFWTRQKAWTNACCTSYSQTADYRKNVLKSQDHHPRWWLCNMAAGLLMMSDSRLEK